MEQEIRFVNRDSVLRLEGYRLQGHCQPFPPHFHSHYVVGLMEDGRCSLQSRGRRFPLSHGRLMLLSPGESHSCAREGEGGMDYRSLSIPAELLLQDGRPLAFPAPVAQDTAVERCLRRLHEMVMTDSQEEARRELLELLLEGLRAHALPCPPAPEGEETANLVCRYLETHYARRVTLDELCRLSGQSKSTLLRVFTRCRGITPYRYLENVRIARAQQLLREGIQPVEAALSAGFSDQSHFTNFFTTFTGVTPGAYRALFVSDGAAEKVKNRRELY